AFVHGVVGPADYLRRARAHAPREERLDHEGRIDAVAAQRIDHLREWHLQVGDLVRVAPGGLDPGARVEPDDVVAGVYRDALAFEVLARLEGAAGLGDHGCEVGRGVAGAAAGRNDLEAQALLRAE